MDVPSDVTCTNYGSYQIPQMSLFVTGPLHSVQSTPSDWTTGTLERCSSCSFQSRDLRNTWPTSQKHMTISWEHMTISWDHMTISWDHITIYWDHMTWEHMSISWKQSWEHGLPIIGYGVSLMVLVIHSFLSLMLWAVGGWLMECCTDATYVL